MNGWKKRAQDLQRDYDALVALQDTLYMLEVPDDAMALDVEIRKTWMLLQEAQRKADANPNKGA